MEEITECPARKYDRTYAVVDLEAIRHNIMEEKRIIRPGIKIMAVVKADAYGHGAVPVSKALYDLVDAYGVATIEEAIELRDAGIDKMILILGYTPESWYSEVVKYDISQTVYTLQMAEGLQREAVRQKKKVRIHIKLDTGMGRIGFAPTRESLTVVEEIAAFSNIEIEGLFTHFARADEKTIDPAREPFEKYCLFSSWLENAGIYIPIHHVSNSASIIGFPEAHLDMVRSGITTYGLYPSEDVTKDIIDLRPAMQWKAHISYIKEVMPGTGIGYGGTFTAEKRMLVATVPVGYADGMKRDLSNKGRVLIHGQYARILGRICMDQFMVDVTDIPEVAEGDVVTIFGVDGENCISVEEISGLSHSFNYEFVCSISKRVPRKY